MFVLEACRDQQRRKVVYDVINTLLMEQGAFIQIPSTLRKRIEL